MLINARPQYPASNQLMMRSAGKRSIWTADVWTSPQPGGWFDRAEEVLAPVGVLSVTHAFTSGKWEEEQHWSLTPSTLKTSQVLFTLAPWFHFSKRVWIWKKFAVSCRVTCCYTWLYHSNSERSICVEYENMKTQNNGALISQFKETYRVYLIKTEATICTHFVLEGFPLKLWVRITKM